MQKEVNDRTAALQKDHADPTKYGDKEKAELEDIQKEQQDVIDLVEEFRHPRADEEGRREEVTAGRPGIVLGGPGVRCIVVEGTGDAFGRSPTEDARCTEWLP